MKILALLIAMIPALSWGSSIIGSVGTTGALTRIAQVVTSGNQTVVTFNNIPQTFTNLRVTVNARATGAASTAAVNLLINSDTTANDYTGGQFLAAQGNSQSSNTQSGTVNGVQAFSVAGTSANSNPLTSVEMTATSYTNTVMGKGILISQFANYTTGPASSQLLVEMVEWLSTSAITRLDFTIASGSYLNGSVFTLYGEQ